jgi:hypothetical protein
MIHDAHDDKRRPAPALRAAGGKDPQLAKTPLDRRFDMWLAKQLRAMYEIESERR